MADKLDDKLSQFSKHIIDSTTEMTQLNAKILNNINEIVQRDYLSEIKNVKKPEDIVALQLKVAASSGVELMSYMQKSGDILTRYMNGLKDFVPTNPSKKPTSK
jgi:hypothetical protein